MAHFVRTLASWLGVTTLTTTHLESFDAKSTAAVNGDDGGAYAPTSKVEIGGQGLDLQGANHVISGTVTVDGSTGSIVWPSGFPAFDGTRALDRIIPAMSTAGGSWTNGQFYMTGAGDGGTAVIPLDEHLIDGAILYRLDIWYRIMGTHMLMPTKPILVLQRVDYTGAPQSLIAATPVNLRSAATDAASYDTAGMVGDVVMPDQYNTIDKTTYRYQLAIIDESGGDAIAGNRIYTIRLRQYVTSARF